MITIHLHNLLFHAYHGIYKEEKVLGNDFEVNADITFNENEKVIHLKDTIDYVTIHGIIKKVMDIPTPLLETVVQKMTEEIKIFDERITSAKVNIKKLNPAITNFNGTVGVSYYKVF